MSEQFMLHAKSRTEQGKGASRRLRKAGLVPAIIYGAGKEPEMVSLDHSRLLRLEQEEAFFASIVKIDIDGKNEQNVIIRDYQRDPVKPKVLHVDFLRISMSEKLHANVPLHFINVETSVGIKAGGILQRMITDLEVVCLPSDLPEAIEIDVSNLAVGDSIHISQITTPEDVELVDMLHLAGAEEDHKGEMDLAVVAIQAPKGSASSGVEAEAVEPESDDSED